MIKKREKRGYFGCEAKSILFRIPTCSEEAVRKAVEEATRPFIISEDEPSYAFDVLLQIGSDKNYIQERIELTVDCYTNSDLFYHFREDIEKHNVNDDFKIVRFYHEKEDYIQTLDDVQYYFKALRKSGIAKRLRVDTSVYTKEGSKNKTFKKTKK